MVAPLAVGDFLKQSGASNGYLSWDGEGFMVVQITPLGGGNVQAVLQRNANFSYCAIGKDGQAAPTPYWNQPSGWTVDAVPPSSCGSVNVLVDIVGNAAYAADDNLMRGHFSVTGSGPGADTWVGVAFLNNAFVYVTDYSRPFALITQPIDYTDALAPPFAGYNSYHDVQSYIDAKQINAIPAMRQFAFDFRHYNGSTGIELEYPWQTIGGPTNLTLQKGTTSVYQIVYSGAPDIKHGIFNVWAGEKYLVDRSSATIGNTLTDANSWNFCYAYQAGECRTGSSVGNLYAAIPRADLQSSCWASQINLRVPCAMAGPDQAMHATQVTVGAPDPAGAGQRNLSSLLMGPGHQYVYSSVLPSPDASYLLFAGYLTHGYHTGLMMAQLPPMPVSVNGPTYVPVNVSGPSGHSGYAEFGYEEYGSMTSFYCTPRQEACRVAAPTIIQATPFYFAHESFSLGTPGQTISIPGLPGHILYYHFVEGGIAGPLQAVSVPPM
jgi:hypothetical protein